MLNSQKSFLESQFSIERIALYGSYAKNSQTSTSDIDLAFDIKEGETFTLEKKIFLETYLTELFQTKIDLVRIKYMNPVIWYQVERELIYI